MADKVVFTKKFQASAKSLFNKVRDLPPHQAAMAIVEWSQAPSRDGTHACVKFYAWAVCHVLSKPHQVIWWNLGNDGIGFHPDIPGRGVAVANEIQLEDVSDDDFDDNEGFTCFINNNIVRLENRETFEAALLEAATKVFYANLLLATKQVTEAQKLVDLLSRIVP